jgi:hypothetical protein
MTGADGEEVRGEQQGRQVSPPHITTGTDGDDDDSNVVVVTDH